jgi:hypothetical protein
VAEIEEMSLEDKVEDMYARLDLMQTYLEELGDRIRFLTKVVRSTSGQGVFQPPSLPNRKAKIMELLSE